MKPTGGQITIPHGWRLVRLGDVAALRNVSSKSAEDGLHPYVALEHISSGGALNGHGQSSDSVSVKTPFQRGDTLFGKLRPNLRKVIRAEFDGVCSTELLAIFPIGRCDSRFLNHLLRSGILYCHTMQGITGTKMPRTSWGHLKTFRFASPPLPEQRAIAAVLDSVDDAIERTGAVIAATEQLRDSLLHQLLTHGVPGWHAEWKDVPGLGTIPAGWEVVRLGEVAALRNVSSKSAEDGLHPYVALEHISSGGALNGHGQSSDSVSVKTPFQKGDTLFGKLRPNLRKVIRAEFDGVCSTELLAIFPIGRCDSRFLNHLLRSDTLYCHTMQGITGTKMPRTSWGHLKTFRFASPPLPEQRAIAAVLDGVEVAIEHAKNETRLLKYLKESTADALLTGRVRVGQENSAYGR